MHSAWQEECKELPSAQRELSAQGKQQLKRANRVKQQRGGSRERLCALVGECRGLVMCEGVEVVRPVQRFMQVCQMRGLAGQVRSETVTGELDGVMVCVPCVCMGWLLGVQ